MQLNPKQEEAKNRVEGPMLIIAGAGSGKTATLTQRVNYMITEKGIPASNIMMVTFTNKAAREMRERIGKVMGVEVGSIYQNRNTFPMVGTFHSIGIFILKEVLANFSAEELNIGLKKDFVIYDESDKMSVIKGIMKNEMHLDEKVFPSRQIAFYISNAKNALITPKGYEAEVDSSIKEVVLQVYTKYEKRLQQNNAMDFDDILVKTLAALRHQKILEIYQERYQYIMVDEYQDTNAPQYEIVRLLALKYRNLAVVGDDAQSIYSWRGANMNNILNFRKDYSDALIVKLEQNYRSTKTIIAGANAVIANNTSGMKKELWTDNAGGEKINYIEAPDDKIEASAIAQIIKDKDGNLKDNLILYRTNAQSRKIEEALMMKGLPYRVVGGQKFYDRKEIKDILSYLRVIHNSSDVVSMKRIINVPTRKIGAKSIEILDNYKEAYNLSYPQILENAEEVEELKPAAKASLVAFNALFIGFVEYSKMFVVAELIAKVIKDTKYEEYMKDGLSADEGLAKRENLDELITVASQYNGMDARESLAQFLEEVALITDMDTKDEREDYVTLMTIHTSKGLEETRVFVTGLEEGIFPSFRSVNDSYALEEERRLMYVAMTRARDELYISRAKERFHFGDYVRNPESRFMKEIPTEHIEEFSLVDAGLGGGNLFGGGLSDTGGASFSFGGAGASAQPIVIKAKANNDISMFNRGDSVDHPKFGSGLILSLNGELAEIAFRGVGTKKMNIRIAPVRKI